MEYLLIMRSISVNIMIVQEPENGDELEIDELERKALANRDRFYDTGMSYALEHGMRTATIGHALSASPIALLSWYG